MSRFILTASLIVLINFAGYCQKVSFAGCKGGMVSKDSLLSANTLEVDASLIISGFTMVHFSKNVVYEYQSITSTLTPQMLFVIQKMKSGDRISFEGIKARGSDGMIYKLNAIALTIK